MNRNAIINSVREIGKATQNVSDSCHKVDRFYQKIKANPTQDQLKEFNDLVIDLVVSFGRMNETVTKHEVLFASMENLAS